MFARKPIFETAIRVSLIVLILFNALVPTAALAKSAYEATSNSGTETSRTLPQQKSLFYNAPQLSYPDQTSPDPDEPPSPVPGKELVEFSIVADPAIVPTNGLITFTVTIRNNSEQPLTGLTFTDALETGLEYSPDSSSPVSYDATRREILLSLQSLGAGQEVSFHYSTVMTSTKRNSIQGKVWLHSVDLNANGNSIKLKAVASLGVEVPDTTAQSEITTIPAKSGWNALGRLNVHMNEDSIGQNAVIVSSPTKLAGRGPELQFNLDIYETSTLATDATGEFNEQTTTLQEPVAGLFNTPSYLEINLDDYIDLRSIPAGQEPYVATYDETNQIWVKVPILEQNIQNNSVIVEAAHFSTWGAGLGSSLPQNGANVLLFDQPYTSLFTGSSRYSIPIWIPAGRAGMQPDVSLSYSSGTVDGVLGDVQAPWVGVGWNIDGVEIVRKITTDENGYGYRNDFALTLNGSLYQLVRDEIHQNRYYTDQAAFLYVERHNYAFDNNHSTDNATGEWWEVVTTDGTRYRLGWNDDSEQLALMYGYECTTDGLSCITPNGAYASLGYAGKAKDMVALRWRVDRVTDTHGNFMEYHYYETHPSEVTTIASFDRESYLQSISYTAFKGSQATDNLEAAYEINFIHADRSTVGDIPSEFNIWDNIDSQLLQSIEIVCRLCDTDPENTPIRTYEFGYTLASAPNANGTLTLTSMKIAGGGYEEDGQDIPSTEAPTVRFTYQDSPNRASGNGDVFTYPRLTTIENGSGGKLTYTYGTDGRANTSWYNYRVANVVAEGGMGIAKKQSYIYGTPIYGGLSLVGYTTVTESVLDYSNGDTKILDTKHTFGTVGLDTGRELQTESIDSAGSVLQKTVNTYVTDNSQAPFPGWNYRYLSSSTNSIRSGGTLVATTKSTYYNDPATGNPLVQSTYTGGNLYRKTYYEYLVNPNPAYYILDKVTRVLLVDASNKIYSDTRYHYDGKINSAPTLGDVTLVQNLTGNPLAPNETVDSVTAYNVYGNVTSTKAYKGYGAVNSDPSAEFVESKTEYDTVQNDPIQTYPLHVVDPAGNSTSSDYLYTLGVPYQTTDPNNWVAETTYDGLGRTLSVTPPGLDQPGTWYIYPKPINGNLPAPHSVEMQILDTIAGKYRSVWGVYDGMGRMLQTQVEAGNQLLVNTTLFNSQGLAKQQSLPYYVNGAGGNYTYSVGNQFTSTTYDALGRVTQVTAPGNIVTQTSYDGLTTTSLDPNGNKVSHTTDALGRMVAVAEFSNSTTVYATTQYFYDTADRLIQMKDAKFSSSFIQYDWLGRKTGMDDPDMGVWTYLYDSLGNMSSQEDARSHELTFDYDNLNRLTTKNDDDSSTSATTYTYGDTPETIGLRVAMSDPSGSTSWKYSNFGRSVKEERTIAGEKISLKTDTDWLGRPITTTYYDAFDNVTEVISYAYDNMGRPEKLTSDQTTLVDLAYNTLGQIETQTLGNGVVITNSYDYDPNGNSGTTRLLNRHADDSNDQSLLNLTYAYDANGNITRLTDNQLGETQFYQYDFLNRLTNAIGAQGISTAVPATPQTYGQQFEYDKVGNILQMNNWGMPPTLQAYQNIDPQVQLVSYHLPEGPEYAPLQQSNFPATSVLDTFNRANGSIGSNWSGYTDVFSISSNQLDVSSADSWESHIYWNASKFSADQEVFVTFQQVDGYAWEQDLLLKAQSAGPDYGDGVIEVLYSASSHSVEVFTYDTNQDWQSHGIINNVTFSAGDQFGARAKPNGDVLVYKNGILLDTKSVVSWTYYDDEGWIGLWFANADTTILDNFGGGTVSSGSTSTPTFTQSPIATTNTPTRTNTPIGATNTPTKTNTSVGATNTPTRTNTPVPFTSTSTNTSTQTNTATVASTNTATITATKTPIPINTGVGTSTPSLTSYPNADVKALLHMDGNDASTSFVDLTGKTWIAYGNAQIDTAQSKFGGASSLFDGSGDYVSTANHADFDFGSGDFTLDLWYRPASLGGSYTLLTKRINTGYAPYNLGISADVIAFVASFNGTSWGVNISGAHGMTVGNWYHIAVVRSGNTFKMFVNGNQVGSTVTASGAIMTNTSVVSIGAIGNGTYGANGSVDEVRITKGFARWTSNFVPPATILDTGATVTPTFTPSLTPPPTITPSNTPNPAWSPTATHTATNSPDPAWTSTSTVTPTPIPGLMAWWNFQNATGTTAQDEAPNDLVSNNATLYNSPTIQIPGPEGYAISFDGVNDYASVADSTEIRNNGSFTVSMWVNPSSLVTSRTQYILRKAVSTSNFDYLFTTTTNTGAATPTPPANVDANGKLVFTVGDLTPNRVIGPVLPINTWSLITGVYDSTAGELRLYINGTLSAVEKVTGSVVMSTGALTFSGVSPNQFHGQLDEVRFYNRALTGSEIQQLLPAAGTPTPLPSTTLTPTSDATFTPTASPMPMIEQQWGTGDDGDYTVSGTFNLNANTSGNNGRTCADGAAYSVTSLGSTIATLSTAPVGGCLNAGDEVMLINLQGTSSSTYNTGVYEFLRVASVSGNTVTFTTMKSHWYGHGFHSDANIGTSTSQQRVMLMRVPNYNNLTVNGTLTSYAWDGVKYGVVAFRVSGTLSGNGIISANGKGFRGAPSTVSYGEGYAGYLANYGGGLKGGRGYDLYVGDGGGGGHGTHGGKSNDTTNDAVGGDAYGNIQLYPAYFGAGGGSGGDIHQKNPELLTPEPEDEPGGAGGAGGGMIFAVAQTINNYSGSIQALGGSGIANGNSRGGGGAGGSIRLEANAISSSLSLTATGGNLGAVGRIAVYSITGSSYVTSAPAAYSALLGQGPTPTPMPTSIYLTPTPRVWSTGKDGDLVVNSGITFNITSTNSNSHICAEGGDAVIYGVTSLSSTWASLSASPSAGCIKVGDEVMLLNHQGTASYHTNTGNYEFLKVGGVVGNMVYFTSEKTKFYGSAADSDANVGVNQTVYLIRVPNYNNVTISGTLSGVVIFRVKGTLSGSGTIAASGLGYTGGIGGIAFYNNDYVPPYEGDNGSQGNGIAPAYVGGGGGGRKGSNTTTVRDGGGGGYGTMGSGANSSGGSTYGSPQLDRLYPGSGGGGGGANNQSGSKGGKGGTGGGIVYILASNINFSGTLRAKGGNGVNGINGGAGGGSGSGGSIRIEGMDITLGTLDVSDGGNGGLGRVAIYYSNSFSNSATKCAQSSVYCQNTSLVTLTATPTASPTATASPTTSAPAGWYENEYTYSSTIPHAVTSVNRVNFTDSFEYDQNGNMTCRVESGVVYLQGYNAENRISSIQRMDGSTCAAPGNTTTKWDFTYDGDGTRTATLTTPYDENGHPQTATVTRYFFGGALEVSNGAVKKYYSFAGQTIAMKDDAGVQYFLTDHLGSIVATLSNTGTLISQQRYLPFGAPRTDINGPYASPTDFGYTGQRKLDSGMGGIMDYKARFYSPYLNQFTQPDTIIPDLSNPQSWNRYSYVTNRPIILNDPTGHDPITAFLIMVATAFILSACSTGPSTEPVLTPRQTEIQDLIDINDYQGAIDKAIEVYDIDTHGVQPVFDREEDNFGETTVSGGRYENGVYVGGRVKTLLGLGAFSSPEDLVDTLAHESVHVEQYQKGRWYGSIDGANLNEIEAFDHVISNKDKLELSDLLIEEDKFLRNEFYKKLPPSIQKRADNRFYSLP